MVGKWRNIVGLTAHLNQKAVFNQNKVTSSVNTKLAMRYMAFLENILLSPHFKMFPALWTNCNKHHALTAQFMNRCNIIHPTTPTSFKCLLFGRLKKNSSKYTTTVIIFFILKFYKYNILFISQSTTCVILTTLGRHFENISSNKI
jgi:hypothetical protein